MSTTATPGRYLRAPDDLLPVSVMKVTRIDGWPPGDDAVPAELAEFAGTADENGDKLYKQTAVVPSRTSPILIEVSHSLDAAAAGRLLRSAAQWIEQTGVI
jgi:hypothetical protein